MNKAQFKPKHEDVLPKSPPLFHREMSGQAPREGSLDFSLSKQGIEAHNTVGEIAGTRQQSATARVGQNSLAHTRLKQTLV